MKDNRLIRKEDMATQQSQMNTEAPARHLSSEEFDALLAGTQSSAQAAHLQACPACRAELESLRQMLARLRAAAIGAAAEHRRLAVMPSPAHRTQGAMWRLWGLTAAAALLCVAGPLFYASRGAIPFATERPPVADHNPAPRTAAVAVSAAPATRETTVAAPAQVSGQMSDAQLMSDIEQDLSSSVPQAMLPLTVRDAPQSPAGTTSNAKENE